MSTTAAAGATADVEQTGAPTAGEHVGASGAAQSAGQSPDQPSSAARSTREEREVEVMQGRVGKVPAGYELLSSRSQEAPRLPGAGRYLYDVQRFVKGADGPYRGDILRVEVATSAASAWRSHAGSNNARNGANPVGRVHDEVAYYAGPERTDGEATSLTWIANNHTKVTVSSTSGQFEPLLADDLLEIARSVELSPSGRRVNAEEETYTTLGTAACSSSCPSSTNMDGISTLTDDWGPDEMVLRNGGTYHRGNLAGVWQAILWADGTEYGYSSSGRTINNCEVDGVFGYDTYEYTRNWQTYRFSPSGTGSPMAADGVVGGGTWSYADNQLVASGPYVLYWGIYIDLYFTRSSYASGHYTWSWNSSPYYYTGYSGIQISKSTSNCIYFA